MKHIYTLVCLFLLSGVANADSVMSTLLFSDPAARFLLTLAEVSVAMTAFSGIAIVIGRRGRNKWTEFDVMRFTTLTVNGVMAVVLCLLPFLLFDPDTQFLEADWEMLLICAGVLGLIEVQWRVRKLFHSIKVNLGADSNWTSMIYVGSDVVIYIVLFCVLFNFIELLEFRMLTYLIMYHLASAIYIFLRMIRHAGIEVADSAN
jgi:hypothetical protein